MEEQQASKPPSTGLTLVVLYIAIQAAVALYKLYYTHKLMIAATSVPEWGDITGELMLRAVVLFVIVALSAPTIYGLLRKLSWARVSAIILLIVIAIQAVIGLPQTFQVGVVMMSPYLLAAALKSTVEVVLAVLAATFLFRRAESFK